MPEHTKTTNSVKNNGEKPHADRTNNGSKANKDSCRYEWHSTVNECHEDG